MPGEDPQGLPGQRPACTKALRWEWAGEVGEQEGGGWGWTVAVGSGMHGEGPGLYSDGETQTEKDEGIRARDWEQDGEMGPQRLTPFSRYQMMLSASA